MSAQRLLLPLLLMVGLTSGASLLQGPRSHSGVCPNQLSPNLWVDAQSTCERECIGDQVSVGTIPTHPGGSPRKLGWPGGSSDPIPWPPALGVSLLFSHILQGFQAGVSGHAPMRVLGTLHLYPHHPPNLPTPTQGSVVLRTSQVERQGLHLDAPLQPGHTSPEVALSMLPISPGPQFCHLHYGNNN